MRKKSYGESNWQFQLVSYLEKMKALNALRHLKWFYFEGMPDLRKRTEMQIMRDAAAGYQPGSSDLRFFWIGEDGVQQFGFMELKRPEFRGLDGKVLRYKGTLSAEQKRFQAECGVVGVRYAVCYNIHEAVEVLKSWGVIKHG